MTKYVWIILFSAFLFTQGIFGQEKKEQPKLIKARALLNDYRDASMFESASPGKFEPSWESIFRDCFAKDMNIIFDVPVKIKSAINARPGETSENNPLSDEYLKFVSINRYIQLVRSIFVMDTLSKIDYQFVETGADLSKLDSDSTIVFEIEKRFGETRWSKAETGKYLFTVGFDAQGKAKISSIRLSDPGISKNEVILVLDKPKPKNAKRKKSNVDYNKDIIVKIKIDFDENVYDRSLIEKFDSSGKINLGLLSNRAKLFIDTAYGAKEGEKFSVPDLWKKEGKKVNPPPPGGFKVALRPYKWNGFAFDFHVEGGGIIQSANNLSRFSENSAFTNMTGYGFGAGFSSTKFLNPDDWIKSKNNWIRGFGAGISIHYASFKITGSQFDQNPYKISDRAGDSALVHFSGSAFEESITTYLIKVPVFFEIRNKFPKNFLGMRSFSLQAGANLMLPFQSQYQSSGTFSRIGEYPQYNGQVITDDDFYNYYTARPQEYNGNIQYQTLMAEGMLKLNGFFPFSKQNPNNTLVLGLMFSFPFTMATSAESGQYQINNGEDDYHSLVFSKEKIYDYYFGISVGFNLIKYKVD